MKAFAPLILLVTAFGTSHAKEKAPAPRWRELPPAELKGYVTVLKTIEEVKRVLGPPNSESQIGGLFSWSIYNLSESKVLRFVSEPPSEISTDRHPCLIESVYLSQGKNDDRKIIWKFFPKNPHANGFREDSLDMPNTRRPAS